MAYGSSTWANRCTSLDLFIWLSEIWLEAVVKRRKPGFIDKEATAAACFLDPRSYIRRGKQYRFGEDMKALRILVFTRSNGHCEMRTSGILSPTCQWNIRFETMEMHHEPPLSQGGDDSLEGCLASCRKCHIARHGRTIRKAKKFQFHVIDGPER
jgi:5-methylcytosine-specific restriction endonuclease McrA